MSETHAAANDFYQPAQPARHVILDKIRNSLALVYAWGEQPSGHRVNVGYTSTMLRYLYHAEALIELLEIHDCGSVGGFDEETGSKHGLYYLEERLAALEKKYT